MRTALLLFLLSLAATLEGAPSSGPAPAASAKTEVIQMHLGVPGLVYVGQPLAEFLAKFPGALTTPVAGQPQVVRVQVKSEGISCLAMGETPAKMTIESIGFNFGKTYEGVSAGSRRTLEGIGSGSSVNDLLGTYGRPAETSTERPPGTPPHRRPRADDPDAPVRHIYRSADGGVTTYFVVQGSEVVRMAIGRPAEIEKHLSKQPAVDARPSAREGAAPTNPPPAFANPPAGLPAGP